jgi:ELWxxDGT repeat protein
LLHAIRTEVAHRTFAVFLVAAVALFVGVSPAHAADARLVKDIIPGGDSSDPLYLERFRGAVYFDAYTPTLHDGLWRSDGTAAGTRLVRELPFPYWLTGAGDTLFFLVDHGRGAQLWGSDGTQSGTTLVRDFPGGILSSSRDLVSHDGSLFLTADDGVHGFELWRSDGTRAGTTLVRDVNPGRASSQPRWATSVGHTLFFTARDGEHGRELWRSDGTADGTRLVRDFRTPADESPGWLTSFRGTLFFASEGGGHGRELWRSDGTADGTRLVRDINPTKGSRPVLLTRVGRTLFLTANDGKHGQELWRSDGTASGTRLVRDIFQGDRPAGYFGPYYLTGIGDNLFFGADDAVHGEGLWRSDGTGAGTKFLKGLRLRWPPVNVGGRGYFTAREAVPYRDRAYGYELWATNGTRAGTKLVRDIYPGREDSMPAGLTPVGGKLFFSATDGAHGIELWKATP